MDEKKRFFDSHITIRISKEMKDIIDFWVSNPQCVFEGKPLFDSRGHFVKASIIKHLRELKERYKAL